MSPTLEEFVLSDTGPPNLARATTVRILKTFRKNDLPVLRRLSLPGSRVNWTQRMFLSGLLNDLLPQLHHLEYALGESQVATETLLLFGAMRSLKHLSIDIIEDISSIRP
jgi:hypothetical protein